MASPTTSDLRAGDRRMRLVAAVLADPVRRDVVLALEARPGSVREIARTLGLTEARVRYQLQYLTNCGLANSSAQREQRTYAVAQVGWQQLLEQADKLARRGG